MKIKHSALGLDAANKGLGFTLRFISISAARLILYFIIHIAVTATYTYSIGTYINQNTKQTICIYIYLIKNSQAVKKGAAPKKAMVKKDVKSKVAAKKWL